MYVACYALATHKFCEVIIGYGVLGHVLTGEMQHHGQGRVFHHINTFTTILLTESPPEIFVGGVVAVREVSGSNIGNCISCLYVGVTTHVLSTNWPVAATSLAAGQILHYNSVVEHTGMNQKFLLRHTQILVTCCSVPGIFLWQLCVALEECLPSVIVSHKNCLGTGTAQNVCKRTNVFRIDILVTQQSQIRVEIAALLQTLVYARIKPTGLFVVQ